MDCSSWPLAWSGLPPFLAPPPNAGSVGGGGGGGPDRGAGGGGGGNGIAISFGVLHDTGPRKRRKQNVTVGQQWSVAVSARSGRERCCGRARVCRFAGTDLGEVDDDRSLDYTRRPCVIVHTVGPVDDDGAPWYTMTHDVTVGHGHDGNTRDARAARGGWYGRKTVASGLTRRGTYHEIREDGRCYHRRRLTVVLIARGRILFRGAARSVAVGALVDGRVDVRIDQHNITVIRQDRGRRGRRRRRYRRITMVRDTRRSCCSSYTGGNNNIVVVVVYYHRHAATSTLKNVVESKERGHHRRPPR